MLSANLSYWGPLLDLQRQGQDPDTPAKESRVLYNHVEGLQDLVEQKSVTRKRRKAPPFRAGIKDSVPLRDKAPHVVLSY